MSVHGVVREHDKDAPAEKVHRTSGWSVSLILIDWA